MSKSEFGVIGLGVMGRNIAVNIAEKGYYLSVFNRNTEAEKTVVSDFLEDNKSFENIKGYTDLKAFVASLEAPRKILILIKAGNAIDVVSKQILPFLSKNDILIDGGNSFFKDTINRTHSFQKHGIHFVGCGISGGEEGARKGPSLMPSGTTEVYNNIAPILETIAAKDTHGNPCCTHVGKDGAGHFVKMVHNGIEYAEMQLLAEVFAILSKRFSTKEIATIFSDWNNTEASSYLLEITSKIVTVKEGEGFLIDVILDKAGNKGTGSWSTTIALELGIPNTMMSAAVFDRYISSFKEKRILLSNKINPTQTGNPIDLAVLKEAYSFARTINHQQGFLLMKEASKVYNWNLNLSEIARIWTNGCIIRSTLMENSVLILKSKTDYFDNDAIFETLVSQEKMMMKILQFGLQNRVSLTTLQSAYTYWIGITTKDLPANIIQAQRDFFGAHTYQRKDKNEDEFFHTDWQKLC